MAHCTLALSTQRLHHVAESASMLDRHYLGNRTDVHFMYILEVGDQVPILAAQAKACIAMPAGDRQYSYSRLQNATRRCLDVLDSC